jgi:hypothetical protein
MAICSSTQSVQDGTAYVKLTVEFLTEVQLIPEVIYSAAKLALAGWQLIDLRPTATATSANTSNKHAAF